MNLSPGDKVGLWVLFFGLCILVVVLVARL